MACTTPSSGPLARNRSSRRAAGWWRSFPRSSRSTPVAHPSSPPPAALRTPASSPRSARRWLNSGRSIPASTSSTSTSSSARWSSCPRSTWIRCAPCCLDARRAAGADRAAPAPGAPAIRPRHEQPARRGGLPGSAWLGFAFRSRFASRDRSLRAEAHRSAGRKKNRAAHSRRLPASRSLARWSRVLRRPSRRRAALAHRRASRRSPAAVAAPAVARRNVLKHRLRSRIRLLRSDLFAALQGEHYDLIVTNPPYVSALAMRRLPPEYRHEPRLALAAGRDGLDLVRRIVAAARAYLTPDGVLACEVGAARPALERAYPRLPFTWPAVSHPAGGVFLIGRAQLPADLE